MNSQRAKVVLASLRIHWVAVLAASCLALAVPITAWAHPLGNFTINHYAGLTVTRQAIDIDYVLDMAEIPAFQEIGTFDTTHSGQPDQAAAARYHPSKCESQGSVLDLRLGGQPVAISLVSSAIAFPPGAGGLFTLRLTCAFRAAFAPVTANVQIEFSDHSYADRLGWREIVANGNGVAVQGEFARASVSQRLTAYPQDMLASPLDQRQVAFVLNPSAAVSQLAASTQGGGLATTQAAGPRDAFTQLITLQEVDLPTFLVALVVAVVWGALHAMTPGHGKTLVGAYLVGSRGTPKHALFLGLATTITHTAGVFALGLVTLFASQFIVPERLFPWLSFVSGLLVVGIGLNLFWSRLKSARRLGASASGHDHSHHADDHSQSHDHDHVPEHDHQHRHDLDHDHSGHSHLPPGADGSPVTWRSLLALGVSGGLLPCPSALVVLLSAIALGRIGFGLVLVLAFSLGLAGTLTAIGLLLVYTGRLVERLPAWGRWVQLVPPASALFITVAGLVITAQAVVQLWWVIL